jgi:hypothetical protein
MVCVNELFYRNGPTLEPIEREDSVEAVEVIKRYLEEAFAAGRKSVSAPYKD